jgi:hypothetical protein
VELAATLTITQPGGLTLPPQTTLRSSPHAFLTTGTNNIALGKSAGSSITSGSSNILIGVSANATSSASSNYLNIGNSLYGTQLGTASFALGVGTARRTVPFPSTAPASSAAMSWRRFLRPPQPA